MNATAPDYRRIDPTECPRCGGLDAVHESWGGRKLGGGGSSFHGRYICPTCGPFSTARAWDLLNREARLAAGWRPTRGPGSLPLESTPHS